MRFKSPVRGPVYAGSIGEVLAEGNCGRAIDLGEMVRSRGLVRTRRPGGVEVGLIFTGQSRRPD
jgi:hypothetical protein